MEFPTAGKHCAQENCNLLDFLPFTCGQCEKVTCLEHKDYAAHDCPEAYKLDVKVPVCQLCNSPVPTRKGEDPNIIMSNHIDQGCREIEISKKTYTNSCMFKNCKKREAVPIACRTCRMNYCMKHRLENSHACEAPKKDAPRSRTGLAAADRARINQEGKPDSKVHAIKKAQQAPKRNGRQCSVQAQMEVNGNMTEDEALARALQQSIS